MFDCPHCGDTHHVNDFCATGPMSSQPSTPMTPPMTPREKVARKAAEAFHNGYQTYDECDETMRMRFDWIADALVGSPALASGSGDHAEHRITADLLVSSLKSDLAEAERKLAEAVGLLRMFQAHRLSGQHFAYPLGSLQQLDTFLSSKEAERG